MTDVPYEIDLTPFSGQAKAVWPKKKDGQTKQRVRRESHPYEAGAGFFRAITSQLGAKIMRAAERFARVSMNTRRPGQRRGLLTDIDVQILEALIFHFMDWKTGRLEPTYEAIARKTGRGRATIALALHRLEEAGTPRDGSTPAPRSPRTVSTSNSMTSAPPWSTSAATSACSRTSSTWT